MKKTLCLPTCLFLILAFLATPLVASAQTTQPPTRPNIVFFLADDLGLHQVGVYGSTYYETPAIDKLASEGMRFTNAYAAATVCSPTRASIMTGKYPARLHLTDYIPGRAPEDSKYVTPDWIRELQLEETTLAESLKAEGYATGHFGKWHLNKDKLYEHGRPGDPGSQGFDDVFTTHKPGAGPESKYEDDWHHVREITEEAVGFIEKNKNRPFFCYVTYNSIHDPEIEKPALVQKYADKKGVELDHNIPAQAAMLETMDKSIATILKMLKDNDMVDNTIVVFFSDNGQKGPKSGALLRGSKGDLYEGGIHMPLIVRWPGHIKPGSVCDELIISNDFFPTFNEIAGASSGPDDIDGKSFVKLLEDTQSGAIHEALYWHFPHYHGRGLGPQGAMRNERYKLVEWFDDTHGGENGMLELYDLQKDPGEQHNLASEQPEMTEQLHHQLIQWRKQVGAQEMAIRENS